MKDAMIGEALNLEKLFLQSREWTDTNLRLKGKKGPPARGAAPQGLGGVEPEGQPLRFAGANHLPLQGRQKEEARFSSPPQGGLSGGCFGNGQGLASCIASDPLHLDVRKSPVPGRLIDDSA